MTEQCRYVLLESRLDGRICFGIAAVMDYDGCMVILQAYSDLCTDRSSAERLAALCNELQISLCHLPDVVDDFIANF